MSNSIILTRSEDEKLLEEIHALQARIAYLTAYRDDLIYHVCPSLRAEYEEKIASLERELLAAQMDLAEKQRIIEILQAQMNRREEPSFKQAKSRAHAEFTSYEEDLKQKAKEAEEFKEYWEKETQWSQHDLLEEHDQSAGEIKDLYRKIVKRLHPDVHPNPTEREKDLLIKAAEAYRKGDSETLRAIWDELCGMEMPDEQYENSEEGRKWLREQIRKLKARLLALENEIDQICSEYPYTMKNFLEDEGAVEERRRELNQQLQTTRDMAEQLQEYIEQLQKQMGGR